MGCASGSTIGSGQCDVQRRRPEPLTGTLHAACTRMDGSRFSLDLFTCRARPFVVPSWPQPGPTIGSVGRDGQSCLLHDGRCTASSPVTTRLALPDCTRLPGTSIVAMIYYTDMLQRK